MEIASPPTHSSWIQEVLGVFFTPSLFSSVESNPGAFTLSVPFVWAGVNTAIALCGWITSRRGGLGSLPNELWYCSVHFVCGENMIRPRYGPTGESIAPFWIKPPDNITTESQRLPSLFTSVLSRCNVRLCWRPRAYLMDLRKCFRPMSVSQFRRVNARLFLNCRDMRLHRLQCINTSFSSRLIFKLYCCLEWKIATRWKKKKMTRAKIKLRSCPSIVAFGKSALLCLLPGVFLFNIITIWSLIRTRANKLHVWKRPYIAYNWKS